MLRYTLLATFWLLSATCAFGDVLVWDGIAGNCTINDENNTITINEPGTYGFRAWDGSSALEEIQSITVNSTVTGDVTVTIAWDEYGGDGATDVWTGNLTHGTYAVYLAGLEISGSLGTTAAGFTCEDVTGDIDITGSVATGGIVTFGDVTGDITVGGDMATGGNVSCDSVTGDITIGGNTYNTLDLGDVDSSSTITITKDLEGTLSANTLGNVLI